jgi:glycosyltransferase involved in cell wall biosynthesis
MTLDFGRSGELFRVRPRDGRMRITALVHGIDLDSARLRIAAYRSKFEAAGHSLDVRVWPTFWLSRLLFLHHLRHCDLLILQQPDFPGWQLRLMRQRVRYLIVDLDEPFADGPEKRPRLREAISLADAVIPSSPALAAHVAQVIEPAKVHCIPTCIDVLGFDLVDHPSSPDSITICVANGENGAGEWVAARLASLEKSDPSVQLRTVCGRSLIREQWRMQDRPARQTSVAADIGVSWVPHEARHAGSDAANVLPLMAAGLPVVANPVDAHLPMVRHGETGLLAESPAEWEQALRTLANDALLRRRLGLAGRRFVESHFHVTVGSNAWLGVLQTLESAPRSRAAS